MKRVINIAQACICGFPCFPFHIFKETVFSICMLVIYQVFPHQNQIVESDEEKPFRKKETWYNYACTFIKCVYS